MIRNEGIGGGRGAGVGAGVVADVAIIPTGIGSFITGKMGDGGPGATGEAGGLVMKVEAEAGGQGGM